MEDLTNQYSYILPYIKTAHNYVPPLFEKNVCGLYMNYSLYGPSPDCLKVLQNLDKKNFLEYPYGGNARINKALADHLKLAEEMVLADHGAANVLNQIFRVVLGKGDKALIPHPGWDYYKSAASLLGANWNQYRVFEKDDRYAYCSREILEKLEETRAKLLIITSPNMPTGNMISQDQLEQIAENAGDVLLVIDEAYYGYADNYNLDVRYLLEKYSNIIFVRTLSKLFGLASERIGFAFSNAELISIIRKTAPLFGISYTSQIIAEAALNDHEFYRVVSRKTAASREKLSCELERLGSYQVYKSEANFILVRLTRHTAEDLVKYFFNNGFVIRECSRGYDLKSHIRISIGTEEINEKVISLFREYEKITDCSNLNTAGKGMVADDTGDFNF